MSSDEPRFGDPGGYAENPFAAPRATDEPGQVEPTRSGELTLNPWRSIWTQPKATIRQIVDSNPAHQIPVLACLAGVGMVLNNNAMLLEGSVPLAAFLGIAVVLGPVAGFLMLYLYGAILGLCCRLLGGVAQGPDMRAAVAWAWVPSIVMLPVALIVSIMYSQADTLDASTLSGVIAVNGFIGFVFGVWGFVISLNTVAEVNLFSRSKAFGAMMLPGVVIGIAVLAILLVTTAVVGP